MPFDEVITLTRALNDQRAFAEQSLHYGRGMLYGRVRTDLARPALLQAEAIFKHLGDVWMLALLRADFGMLALLDGELDEARSHFEQARVTAVALHDRILEIEVLNNPQQLCRWPQL